MPILKSCLHHWVTKFMSGAHAIEPFQNFLNTSVIWDPNLNVSSISDVLRIPFDRTFIDGRWPTSCGCNRPREVLLALWFSIANISRECLFLTSRKSAGITTTKLKSRMKPRFVKEKSSSSSSSAAAQPTTWMKANRSPSARTSTPPSCRGQTPSAPVPIAVR